MRSGKINQVSGISTLDSRRHIRVCKTAALLFSVVFTLGLVACKPDDGQSSDSTVSLASTGSVQPYLQREGDVEKGYRVATEQAAVTCGLPLDAYTKLPAADPILLPDRSGASASLPYFYTLHETDEISLVTTNCLVCHAAELFGELFIGLGNETLDFTVDQSVYVERAGGLVEGNVQQREWEKWADRIASIAPYMRTDTVGVNPANNLTLALIAHRDPETLAWSAEPVIEPPPRQPLPVSVPPWWRMGRKHSMFYTSEGRGDHARLMMSAALLCTDSVEEATRIDADAPHLRAWLSSIEPPEYPFAIDQQVASEGETLFVANCSRCHGTYGDKGTYPNLIVPLEEVGTDPELALRATQQSGRFIDWYNASFFGQLGDVAPAAGYSAPPLDGVWATAPFLHNGSVPTIDAVLNSEVRPTYWKPALSHDQYDEERLGWQYEESALGKSEHSIEENKYIYDTTLTGYSSQGHLFGDHLSQADRRAVIEYLKTL